MNAAFKSMVLFMMIFQKSGFTIAQIPVEVFGGDKKLTLDIMFFKFFKKDESRNSEFLFFNRNRTSMGYSMASPANLPQFGFIEAISYNHRNFKGFAPVVVASITNGGFVPKTGVQFSKINKNYTLFSWLVCETQEKPNMDYFFLGRYTPRLSEKLKLFTQIELFNTFPTVAQNNLLFSQRFRIGLKVSSFQFGFGADLSKIGRKIYIRSTNTGGFLRYEFQ